MIPESFKIKMQQMLGPDEFNIFLDSYSHPSTHALRINPLKTDGQLLKKAFEGYLSPIPWSPFGFYYEDGISPGKHPYHEAGAYYIQEPSAMAPAEYLDIKPDDIVLDLCAAPGGKSTQIAAKLTGNGFLVSNEINPSRAKILSENIERMGIRNAIVTNESPARLTDFFSCFFDKILVDAPCSGEGMFRKNPDACSEWSLENVKMCANRQAEILDCASLLLKPGGRIVYSTCTFSPEENEGTISAFLSSHDDFSLVEMPKTAGMSDGLTAETKPCIRLFPHRLKGEGHFIAVLKHSASDCFKDPKRVLIKGAGDKLLAPYYAFSHDFLRQELKGIPVLFGDHLSFVPPRCPRLDKLKVLRAGLSAGAFAKNRFEPSHSLAMALHAKDVNRCMPLSAEKEEIFRYLNGEALPYTGEKGWYLVTVDGISAGLGKLSGDLMKNHYPKGLRKKLLP